MSHIGAGTSDEWQNLLLLARMAASRRSRDGGPSSQRVRCSPPLQHSSSLVTSRSGSSGNTLPDGAYTATVLAGLAVSAVAYGLAVLWLRRLP